MIGELWASTLILFILILVWFVGLLWALIDIARQKRDTGYKIIWGLICLLFGLIGILVYYFAEVRKRKKEVEMSTTTH